MPRKLVFLSTVLVALAMTTPASAARPERTVHPSQGDFAIVDQCAFPVGGHIDGPEIITTFTDVAHNRFKEIVSFPGNKITLTNLDTGASITIMGTGSSQVRVDPDGSATARAMGHGPFFPNPLTGEPGIWYLSGQGTSTFDAHGNMTSAVLHGRLVDLCPQLAS